MMIERGRCRDTPRWCQGFKARWSDREGGTLTLAIGLDGANPAVLDGYPFRFNVNLSGQLAPILAAVREGRRIGAELLHGGLGSRP